MSCCNSFRFENMCILPSHTCYLQLIVGWTEELLSLDVFQFYGNSLNYSLMLVDRPIGNGLLVALVICGFDIPLESQ